MLTSKWVLPHEHDILTISGQGAQAPLQQKTKQSELAFHMGLLSKIVMNGRKYLTAPLGS